MMEAADWFLWEVERLHRLEQEAHDAEMEEQEREQEQEEEAVGKKRRRRKKKLSNRTHPWKNPCPVLSPIFPEPSIDYRAKPASTKWVQPRDGQFPWIQCRCHCTTCQVYSRRSPMSLGAIYVQSLWQGDVSTCQQLLHFDHQCMYRVLTQGLSHVYMLGEWRTWFQGAMVWIRECMHFYLVQVRIRCYMLFVDLMHCWLQLEGAPEMLSWINHYPSIYDFFDEDSDHYTDHENDDDDNDEERDVVQLG